MTGFLIEPGAIYERAAEVAERALVVDPDSGFALGDIVEAEDELAAVLHESVAAQMLVEGILAGCVAAITQLSLGEEILAQLPGRPPVPADAIVQPEQFDTAVSWLRSSVAGRLDDVKRSELVAPVIWGDADLTRRSGLALALIITSDIVCQEARTRSA